jgi:hypothetical protein
MGNELQAEPAEPRLRRHDLILVGLCTVGLARQQAIGQVSIDAHRPAEADDVASTLAKRCFHGRF